MLILVPSRADARVGGRQAVLTSPGVDAADHVLGQEIGGCDARSCGFRQQQYDQSPHLEVVLAVVDEAPAKRARRAD